ncbi:MAG: class I SAM-dependent DNA methyltransferase [Campylobacter sp.]|uniref:type I restriction-modification system subunit M n=1 Tax=Campylobacter sp. TaxID=205 RepID=UPI002A80B116|nr:class I SAM-dependent DNA methyltransferase [Campylobacter sp.]MCI7587053.1 type I restriction-modification system subunit M [Campylobacter sp.]MDY5115220.1 class I SAM-dependent DNA methyltransferase [Campylobacter sp.]
MSLNTISNIGVNIQEKATVIWNVADMLRGPFKPHEYGLVILPMTVVKRFNDCLMPTYNEVQKAYQDVKHLAVIDGFLTTASGYQFYNISKFTFDSLLADPQNIEANFRDYLAGFSSNIQDILAKFDFENIIKRMVESNTLYLVIREFNTPKGYLGPDKISAVDCGYIFEDLVKRFSESYGEEAGAHFTSRDIIYLMTDILLNEADLATEGNITVYDMTMGTSQMLSCMEERIHAINKNIEVTCFGQEFNPSTFAIAKADMMIRGGDPNNMRFGDTLSDDQFSGYTFKYCISNPPFGIDWKREQKAVEAEAKLGENGRFGAGLPKISDGQQLFVLNGISKLAPDGKMAIIQNGSPLFSGDAGSGPSNIRQYILENDWLDAIIQLSTDQFMNTSISTYIWVISKDKPSYKAGKVQLIDASHCYKPRRKSIGKKKNDITDACRELIIQAYGEFKNNAIYGDKSGVYCESKIFDTVQFGYNKIVVERPLRDENGEIVKKAGKPVADTSLRDTENVPLDEDIDRYFKREILPYAMDAWIDKKKTKVGYEIPMTRYFYEYKAPESADSIVKRINKLEADIATSLKALFDKESN